MLSSRRGVSKCETWGGACFYFFVLPLISSIAALAVEYITNSTDFIPGGVLDYMQSYL